MVSQSADAADRTLVRAVLVLVAVLVLAPLFAMGLGGTMLGGMGWGMHDGAAVGLAPWWGLAMGLVWLVVLLALGFVGYRALVGGPVADDVRDAALEELRLAYARGDLTDEEFRQRRTVLTDEPDPEP